MRTRTTTSSSPSSTTCYRKVWRGNCIGGLDLLGTYPEVVQYNPLSVSRTMNDVVTVGFHKRRRQGAIICNPFDSVTQTDVETVTNVSGAQGYFTPISCNGQSTQVPYFNEWSGSYPAHLYTGTGYLTTPSLDQSRLIDLATTGAWAKCSSSEIQGLVSLAEGHKTIDSCKSIFKRIFKLGRLLRRRDARGLYRELSAKKLADRYMEARYAIRPMIYDMKDALKAFQAKKDPKRVTFRSGASDQVTLYQNDVQTWYVSGFGLVKCNKVVSSQATARAGVLAALDSISDASIWGLDQPFSAIWELVPFSFVVDWFANVGKTIAAWSPTPGIHALASWCVVRVTTVATIAVASSSSLFNQGSVYRNDWKATGGFVSRTTESKYRIVNPNRTIVPVMKINLDGFKLLDLAIMAKRFW